MDGPRLRVASYNVHGLRDDRAALIEVARALRPDVLILQEAPRRWRWRTRSSQLARSFGLVYAVGGQPSLGNVIMTSHRVRVHEGWCLSYPLTPGRHLRGAAFARCSLDRVPFVVAGSHLATDDAGRPGQANLLKKALSEVSDPLVLGVDVNEEDTGSSWQTLAEGMVDAASAAGLADRMTFPVRAPRRRIDLLLVDPRVRIAGYQVVDSAPARAASDHFPIAVDLVLPAASDR
jgi:endonuclease/exonuclease/phosphatase family metal-dependent hydrolase